jgi:hypothetical protein
VTGGRQARGAGRCLNPRPFANERPAAEASAAQPSSPTCSTSTWRTSVGTVSRSWPTPSVVGQRSALRELCFASSPRIAGVVGLSQADYVTEPAESRTKMAPARCRSGRSITPLAAHQHAQ